MSSEKETLLREIHELELRLQPKREQLNEIYRAEESIIEQRIKACNRLEGSFELHELLFASESRCRCGAGYAYPNGISLHGSWVCSAILLGQAEKGSEHSGDLPFAFYEIKSENQPSAYGITTRPAC